MASGPVGTERLPLVAMVIDASPAAAFIRGMFAARDQPAVDADLCPASPNGNAPSYRAGMTNARLGLIKPILPPTGDLAKPSENGSAPLSIVITGANRPFRRT